MKRAEFAGRCVRSILLLFALAFCLLFLFAAILPILDRPNIAAPQDPKSAGELAAAIESQQQDAEKLSRSDLFEQTFAELSAKAQDFGTVRVIVRLRVAFRPEGELVRAVERQAQRGAIKQSQDDLFDELYGYDPSSIKRLEFVPYVGVRVNAAGLESLRLSSKVLDIQEDRALSLALSESVPIVGATNAWASGYTGSGKIVVILDTGVDKTHPFLSGKVVSEACYSTNDPNQRVSSLCPGGVTETTAIGSGVNCTNVDGCDHGTHVAGIAAGKGPDFSGVAKDANVISIQVFSSLDDSASCAQSGHTAPCVTAFPMDIMRGLDRVYALRNTYSIAAVNMSLGGGKYTNNCDTYPLKATIDQLRSVGIATVIASGNDSYTDGISAPACISSAISVGATGGGGSDSESRAPQEIYSRSNSASFLNLLAPGVHIYSSVPGGGFENMDGTSMAAPHVAGAWAILKQKSPTASVTEILNALTATGASITDPRNGISKPRIRINAAAGCVASVPTDRWKGEYFNNHTLTGSPAMVSDDGAGPLSFDWGGGSPSSACGLGIDNFSTRWSRTVNFAAGTYRFTASGDDGIRLYVDGQLRINAWVDQPETTYTADVPLSAGNHDLKFEFYEAGGGAVARLSWVAVSSPAPVINSISPASPTASASNQDVVVNGSNFQQGLTVGVFFPGNSGSTPDVTLSGSQILNVTATSFTMRATLGSAGTWGVRVNNPNGQQSMRFDFIVVNGSSCIASVSSANWKGEYFNNRTLTGSPAMVRDDGAGPLSFDWGGGSPSSACGLGIDNFSARWTRTVHFAAGTYRFTASGDDGIRLYVDGQLKINAWVDQPETTYTADVPLSAGNHDLRFEFYEAGGGAVARLSWAAISGPAPVINSISPASPTASASNQDVVVNGSNFQQGLTVGVFFPGNSGTTPDVTLSGSQILNVTATSFTMRATLGSAGTWGIRVNNPDGQQSTRFGFTVQAQVVDPFISGISPSSPIATVGNQNVAVNGANFLSGLTVTVTFPSGGSATLSGSQILNVTGSSFTMVINFNGNAGSYSIRVNNPNGRSSNPFGLTTQSL